MSDFTKTGVEVDAWAVVTAATIREGAIFDIPDDIGIAVEITRCKVEAVAHDGKAYSIVELSSNTTGDEDWTEFLSLQTQAETAVATTLDAEATAAATTVPLTTTTNMETKGDKYLIKNGTPANSEIVRNNGSSTGVSITILDGLTNTQQNGVGIFTTVEQYSLSIPAEYRRGRVLTINNDADCDMMTRTRIAKITDIE